MRNHDADLVAIDKVTKTLEPLSVAQRLFVIASASMKLGLRQEAATCFAALGSNLAGDQKDHESP